MDNVAQLQILIKMYHEGFLCKCRNFKHVESKDETVWFDGDLEEPEKELIHDKDCTGIDKMKELMGFK